MQSYTLAPHRPVPDLSHTLADERQLAARLLADTWLSRLAHTEQMATEQQARALSTRPPCRHDTHMRPHKALYSQSWPVCLCPLADRRVRDGREANDRAKQAAPQGRDLDHHPLLVHTAAQEDNALLWASWLRALPHLDRERAQALTLLGAGPGASRLRPAANYRFPFAGPVIDQRKPRG